MAFGFSPQYQEHIDIPTFDYKRAYVVALTSVKKLKWEVSQMGADGFIAYTKFSMSSWSEEVKVKITDTGIEIVSECAGTQLFDWGKNKQNVESFKQLYESENKGLLTHEVETRFAELETSFAPAEEDIFQNSPLSNKGKAASIFSIFVPTEGYFITPILLVSNILIFLIMVLSGVDPFAPNVEDLLTWGANFRPQTLNGEWWRLITSCFLHIGVFHLLMNLYALVYIGVLLEPHLGKTRFLSAYILAGFAGSAASVYWNELIVSAGASGAIFGLYGLFLALLTTNLIEKNARKAIVTSIAVFVGYNLLSGMQGDIDNAAHIGGLISGLVIGYSFYLSLTHPHLVKLKYGTVLLLSIFTVSSSLALMSNTADDIANYEREMQRFIQLESMALGVYNLPESASKEDQLFELKNVGIYNWNESLLLLDRVDELDIPEVLQERAKKMRRYCELRIKSFTAIYKSIEEDTGSYDEEIEEYTKEIDQIVKELTGS